MLATTTVAKNVSETPTVERFFTPSFQRINDEIPVGTLSVPYTASNMINTNKCMLIATVEHTYLRFKLGEQSVDIVSATDPLDCVFMCRSSNCFVWFVDNPNCLDLTQEGMKSLAQAENQ